MVETIEGEIRHQIRCVLIYYRSSHYTLNPLVRPFVRLSIPATWWVRGGAVALGGYLEEAAPSSF